jgi:hypothetical protein
MRAKEVDDTDTKNLFENLRHKKFDPSRVLSSLNLVSSMMDSHFPPEIREHIESCLSNIASWNSLLEGTQIGDLVPEDLDHIWRDLVPKLTLQESPSNDPTTSLSTRNLYLKSGMNDSTRSRVELKALKCSYYTSECLCITRSDIRTN